MKALVGAIRFVLAPNVGDHWQHVGLGVHRHGGLPHADMQGRRRLVRRDRDVEAILRTEPRVQGRKVDYGSLKIDACSEAELESHNADRRQICEDLAGSIRIRYFTALDDDTVKLFSVLDPRRWPKKDADALSIVEWQRADFAADSHL